MKLGIQPNVKHNGLPWDVTEASDKTRSVLAGTPLGFKGLIIVFKCDWGEVSRLSPFLLGTTLCRPSVFA
jgi:hypothetical protein